VSRAERRAREDDPQDGRVLVLARERPEVEQLGSGVAGEPVGDVAAGALPRASLALERVAHVRLEPCEVVLRGLHAHQEAVEGRDVDADGVVPGLEALDEGRPRARERVEDSPAGSHVAAQERLHELRDELPEVRVEAVDVLRALALGELRLGPREVETRRQLLVEGGLGRSHQPSFDAA
jgi:hypothetical protein